MMQSKEERYDRQIRLWGGNSQRKLERSAIIVLRCHPVICEALESLIASGVTQLIVVDDQTVSDEDEARYTFALAGKCGSDAAGRSADPALRSEVLLKYLEELNPMLRSRLVPMDPTIFARSFQQNRVEVFLGDPLPETVIMICANEPRLELVMEELYKTFCPLVQCYKLVVTAVGPYAQFKLMHSGHLVTDARYANCRLDLSLSDPLPSLRRFTAEYISECLSSTPEKDSLAPKEIPWLMLVIYAYMEYESQHNAKPTDSAVDRQRLRDSMESLSKRIDINEERLVEARNHLHLCLLREKIPKNVTRVLQSVDKIYCPLEREGVRVLGRFVTKYGKLPLSGDVPDMVSDTDVYLKIVESYRRAAASDFENLKSMIQVSMDGLEAYLESMTGTFRFMDFVEAEPVTYVDQETLSEQMILEELSASQPVAAEGTLGYELSYGAQSAQSICSIWLALTALRDTGLSLKEVDADAVRRKYTEVAAELGSVGKKLMEDQRGLESVLTFVKLPYNPMSSGVVGGMIGSEVLKVLTGCFVPAVIVTWDGVTSRSCSF